MHRLGYRGAAALVTQSWVLCVHGSGERHLQNVYNDHSHHGPTFPPLRDCAFPVHHFLVANKRAQDRGTRLVCKKTKTYLG